MELLFAKMGLEEAANRVFTALDAGLEPKVLVEDVATARGPGSASEAPDGRVWFRSGPIQHENNSVRIVLGLRRQSYEAYYNLRQRTIVRGFETMPSLLVSAVHQFLRESLDALRTVDIDPFLSRLARDAESILRAAAKHLMYNPAMCAGYGEGHAARLFFDCNSISYLRYERQENTGSLLLARRGHPNVEPLLMRRNPLPLAEHRAVRKLLEMATQDVSVLADGYQAYGLGRVTGKYDETEQDLYSVRFVSQSNWEFLHGGRLMMRVLGGRPQLPDIRLESRFHKTLWTLFPGLGPAEVQHLWQLASAAADARRGAILVISSDAEAEALRLENGSTRIEPVRLNPEMMRRVCAIDGAVMVDTGGVCHAIGVILDGIACAREDASRGSRYNSAVRYAKSAPQPCLIAIVSEDGGMDLVASSTARSSADEAGAVSAPSVA